MPSSMDPPQHVHPSTANKEALKKLKAAIESKRAADKKVAMVEASIANFEGSYLQETAASGGNIIKGFDQYMKLQPATFSAAGRRRFEVHDSDRLFSMSSGSYYQSMELLANERIEQARLDAEYSTALARQNNTSSLQPPSSGPLRGERQPSESTSLLNNGGGGSNGGGGTGGHKKRKREERERERAEREKEREGTGTPGVGVGAGGSSGLGGGRKKHRSMPGGED